MKNSSVNLDYKHYSSLNQLEKEQHNLVKAAQEAAKFAYAPYSEFRVGAAVLLDNGEIMSASNQESEVYPSGICAERALLYYVQANARGRHITKLAIVTISSEGECYPCGACRQVIVDTENRQKSPIEVIMAGADSATVVKHSSDLLPFTFKLKN